MWRIRSRCWPSRRGLSGRRPPALGRCRRRAFGEDAGTRRRFLYRRLPFENLFDLGRCFAASSRLFKRATACCGHVFGDAAESANLTGRWVAPVGRRLAGWNEFVGGCDLVADDSAEPHGEIVVHPVHFRPVGYIGAEPRSVAGSAFQSRYRRVFINCRVVPVFTRRRCSHVRCGRQDAAVHRGRDDARPQRRGGDLSARRFRALAVGELRWRGWKGCWAGVSPAEAGPAEADLTSAAVMSISEMPSLIMARPTGADE